MKIATFFFLMLALMVLVPVQEARGDVYTIPSAGFPALDYTHSTQSGCHTIETKDLYDGWSSTPDTYLFVFKEYSGSWQLVAEDDDGGVGYASKVTNICTSGENLRILVVAYTTNRQGTCDLYIDGNKVIDDMMFGASWFYVSSGRNGSYPFTPTDRFVTTAQPSTEWTMDDAVLYAVGGTGSLLMFDDDNHLARQSQIAVSSSCSSACRIIVAPYWGAY